MKPQDVKGGERVRIIDREFKGKIGVTTNRRESGFGYVWVDVCIEGMGGQRIVKRPVDIELVEPPASSMNGKGGIGDG